MADQKTIITLTMNATLDISTSVKSVAANRKLRCEPPRYEPGGGGINVSRAIAKLDGESNALYTCGGPTGTLLENALNQEEVDNTPIPISGLTRQNLTVLEDQGDRQFRFNMPGPELTQDEWQGCLDELRSYQPRPDYVVMSGSLPRRTPEDFYARAARIVQDRGGRVILDASSAPLKNALQAGVFLLKPNIRELKQVVGQKEVETELELVTKPLVADGKAQVVVVSLGSAGALLVTQGGAQRLRAPTVPILSKIGAGDSMVAGIVLSLARGYSIQEAARFGVAAGSAAVMTPGTELCRREDVERLYRQISPEAEQ